MEARGQYYSTGQRLQWHPEIHEQVGHESLYYWFLTFSTSYEWDDLRNELLGLLDTHDVHSFALYELMGDCDVMLRVWLPQGTAGVFRASMRARLQRFSLVLDLRYTVEKVIRHWPFGEDGQGALSEVEPDARHPDLELIERVNEKLTENGSLEDPELAKLARAGAIGPKDGKRDQIEGVKIVTLVKPMGELGPIQKGGLARQMALTLDEQEKIVQRSLYEVDGFGAAFLLTCLVPLDDFFCFRKELVGAMAPFFETAGIRTTSYSCGSPDLLMFQDVIPQPSTRRRPAQVPFRRVEDLLRLDESMTLEVKGSAFAPLAPHLLQGEELLESPSFFSRSVLKTIVGFLNSEGGTIVIGALEPSRFQQRPMINEAPEFREIGAYLCAGIVDPIYRRKGWDAYERKMSEAIEKNVSPAPDSLVRIRNEEVDGLVFCVVDVAPGHDIGWHYLDADGEGPQFMVRRGARTVHLQGVEADKYKDPKR
jgi:hypothetical protein